MVQRFAVRVALVTATVLSVAGTVAVVRAVAGALPVARAVAGTSPVARAQSTDHGPRGPIAVTDKGAVRGLVADGIEKYLGIPYAAPPVGALRWHPPVPAARWHGVRQATSYGNRCPQLASSNGPGSDNEDCLYLNVFEPLDHFSHRGHGHGLPVLFWIHGGGFENGAGDQHDGALLARANHITVVSINYRLGVFGFLALPSLSSESADQSSGDYGLLDQQAALRWTRRNIAAFGGDPRRITVAGESAGGWATCMMLASPTARGLFDGAIIQSGSCPSRTLAGAESSGADFASRAGCPDPAMAAACLRAKPAATLLAVQPDAGTIPVAGAGATLPVPPAQAIASGNFNRVPVINGSNHDEGRTFAQDLTDLTEAQYDAFVSSQYGSAAPKVLAQYPFGAFPSPYTSAYAIGAIWTDSGAITGIGGCGTLGLTRRLAQWTPTFQYEFADEHAPDLNSHHPGYQWGAGHAMELAYMWPSFDNGTPLYPQLTPAQLELSDEMVHYWGSFTRFGTPSAPRAPAWPEFGGTDQILSLQPGGATQPITEAGYRAEHKCDFWDSVSSAG